MNSARSNDRSTIEAKLVYRMAETGPPILKDILHKKGGDFLVVALEDSPGEINRLHFILFQLIVSSDNSILNRVDPVYRR